MINAIKPIESTLRPRNLPQRRQQLATPQPPKTITHDEERAITRYAHLSQRLFDALAPFVNAWEGAEPVQQQGGSNKYAIYVTLDEIINAQRALNENTLDIYA